MSVAAQDARREDTRRKEADVQAPAGSPGQRAREIESLVEEIEAWPDSEARTLLQDCLQAVLTFYGDGLARILQLTRNAGSAGREIVDALSRDDLVRSLLLIHGIHPESLETRLLAALERIRPYLKSHGGNVELAALEGDVARLRLLGTCQGCPSSAITLELAVRQAVEEACPELKGFTVEGLPPANAVPLPRGGNIPRWRIVEGFTVPKVGEIHPLSVDGVMAIICNLEETFYAYRNRCSECGCSLEASSLEGSVLSCPSGHRFELKRAGISMTDPNRHLDPFPLLMSGDFLKIAVSPRET